MGTPAPPSEADDNDDEVLQAAEGWHAPPTAGARTTDEAAALLSGREIPPNEPLEAIFPPTFRGRPLSPDEIVSDIGRGPVMRVLAQMECTLGTQEENDNG